jgi:transcriptional regulator with XRE-family HTH domain
MADRTPRAVAERFGENLRRLRRRQGFSQGRLAAQASLHRTEIGLLEHGERTCRIDTLIQLAGAMGVPPGELDDGIDWIPGPEPRGAFSLASALSHPRPPRGGPRR